MATSRELHLYEELTLLALRDKKGTLISSSTYPYAVGGAVLAELLLHEHIRVVHEKKKKFVELIGPTQTGDPIIDECLQKIRTSKKRSQLKTWVSRFAHLKRLKHRAAQQLCRRGILRADEDRILRIFTRKIYPELDPRPEKRIVERLRTAIFTDQKKIAPRTVVLVALAQHGDLLKTLFDKKQLKPQKKRIKQIIDGELVGQATKEAIEAMRAAVAIVVIMPAIS